MRKHWKLIWRVFPYLRPFKRLAASTAFITVLSSVVALAQPWPLAFLVDGVLSGKPEGSKKVPTVVKHLFGTRPTTLILVGVLAGLLLTIVVNGLSVADEYVKTKLSLKMIQQFRSDLFGNALRQSVAFHDARAMGDFIARINYESSAMGGITVALPPLAQSLLTLVGMAYITYRIDHELALLAMVVVPFIYYSTGYYGRHIEPRIRKVRGGEGGSLRIVYEAMSMLRTIAVFNNERYEHDRFHTQSGRVVDSRVRLTVRQSFFSFVVNLITGLGTALVLGVGALHVVDGRLSIGQVLVLLSYVHSIYGPLEAISHSMASFQEQFIYLDMSLELLDEVPDIEDKPGAVELPPVRGAVSFEGVSFAYKNRESTLEDITFDVAPGEAIAIVGPTGAGKSTLMSLLSRLCEPAEGRVTIDGLDLRDVTLQSLRRQVSVVLQEPALFTGTVAYNIRYGRLDATDEEVVQAAMAANAHDFIMRLPDQYDTVLGENGTALSGGEKQRICVARAFLKDAPILILDEPTSSIDSRTEAAILDALETLMQGRTTFVIAHRLSTLRSVDRILVIDRGRLVEQGTHQELLQRNGLYKALHDVQKTDRSRYHDDALVAEAQASEQAAMRSRIGLISSVLDRLSPRVRQPHRPALGLLLDAADGGAPTPPPLPSASFRAEPNPVTVGDGATSGATELVWTAVGCDRTEIRIDAPDGPLFAAMEHDRGRPVEERRATDAWVTDGMTFYLQDATDGRPLTAEHTLATVTMRVLDPTAPPPETVSRRDMVLLPPESAIVLDRGRRSEPGTLVLRLEYGETVRTAMSLVRTIRRRGRRIVRSLLATGPRPTHPGGRTTARPGARTAGRRR